ncbi:LysM peptidoglycan-binding domain-containing protein [Flavobacterium branchiophilum]|uniref:Lytic transglycosylase n=1 Tax=Flavobacterium branchiophilum TaxID=55197 RepID=A0A2H3L1J7_9FLAO|nr:LysM peptidoglycan-binding domain-containing protein [Flavobacterium branchiophilum]PDS26720.1 lytic transglycosylase [Flavobacterium branchiophilum]
MTKKVYTLAIAFFASTTLFAQHETDSVVRVNNAPKVSVLDSLKKTFIKHDAISKIDAQWMKELSNDALSAEQFEDISNMNMDETVAYDLPTDILKARLKKLDAKSPFNIEYNPGLENVIKSLLKNRKKSYARLMAIAEYYFPMFEDALSKYDIPLEVKYLAIVESALNPRAKSRVGAGGLWQFMYGTGLQYNLNVNSYIDERSDPLKSTEAACKYLSGMYKIFGDWDLVLASYNCGPGNVTKAIRRSNGQKNYWNIRKNLPQETAGYLPAFLATMYIFEYHKEHGITPLKAPVTYFSTDTLMVKRQLSFKQISNLLDIPVTELQFLNPSYKLDVIPFEADKQNYLRLPQDKVAVFASNEDKIYYYADYEDNLRERPNTRPSIANDSLRNNRQRYVTRYKFHKVGKGDSLSEIAQAYGISKSELKKWNHLRSDKAPLGRNLKIRITEKVQATELAEAKTPKLDKVTDLASQDTNKPQVEKTSTDHVSASSDLITEKVVSFKNVTKSYKVKKGDDLGDIARQYDVAVSDIKKWNKLKGDKLKKGKTLKIHTTERVVTTVRKKEKKPVTTHEDNETLVANNDEKPEAATKIEKEIKPESKNTKFIYEIKEEKVVAFKDVAKSYKVKSGDNLSEIAEKFNVSVAELKKWNKIKGSTVNKGKTLKIISNEKVVTVVKKKVKKEVEFKSEQQLATVEPKEVKTKKVQKADTTKATNEYLVKEGETLATIAKNHKTTVANLKKWNNFEDNSVEAGTKLVVSKPEHAEAEWQAKEVQEYVVEKGDNVWKIIKKYNISLADLRAWNNLTDNNIQLGTTLIVSKPEVSPKEKKQLQNNKMVASSKNGEKMYQVKKGDSLFSISQKYPGVTVSDLKKWNGIRDGDIKPGMKLKISG